MWGIYYELCCCVVSRVVHERLALKRAVKKTGTVWSNNEFKVNAEVGYERL